MAAPVRKRREASEAAQTGWSLRHPLSKRILEIELVSDHPVCGAAVASRLFIDAAASPPHEALTRRGVVPSICDFLCKAPRRGTPSLAIHSHLSSPGFSFGAAFQNDTHPGLAPGATLCRRSAAEYRRFRNLLHTFGVSTLREDARHGRRFRLSDPEKSAFWCHSGRSADIRQRRFERSSLSSQLLSAQACLQLLDLVLKPKDL